MKVSDALNWRISVRAFLDKPVSGEIVKDILRAASSSPSGGNLQPWHVRALGGQELARFKALMAERIKNNPIGEPSEYNIYPPELKEPYRTRRFKNGEDLYRTIGIPREDKAARLNLTECAPGGRQGIDGESPLR
ncbi:nitroreductase family protein [Bradyrhizobium sp. USDA 10063]